MVNDAQAPRTWMLYDRIWHGNVLLNTTAAQTVTMTPARYSTTGNDGTSRGNVALVEVHSVTLTALAHTWTLQYVDHLGNAAENGPVETGLASSAQVGAIDLNSTGPGFWQWCFRLNSGDLGISDLTQITLSATLAVGGINLVLAHPLGLFPGSDTVHGAVTYDCVGSAFNMVKIETDACLGLLDVFCGNSNGTLSNVTASFVTG